MFFFFIFSLTKDMSSWFQEEKTLKASVSHVSMHTQWLVVFNSCLMFYALLSKSGDTAESPLSQQTLFFITLSFNLLSTAIHTLLFHWAYHYWTLFQLPLSAELRGFTVICLVVRCFLQSHEIIFSMLLVLLLYHPSGIARWHFISGYPSLICKMTPHKEKRVFLPKNSIKF